VTLTKNYTIPAGVTVVDNIGTACGRDPLTIEVCDTDTHHLGVTFVLGETEVRPDVLPRTGSDDARQLLVVGLALSLVLAVRRTSRRNKRIA
jgi:LPXTG-motif cell wall-anchored protein